MRPQRKLLTSALETRASQPRTGTALIIDIMQTIGEPLLVLDSYLGVISANRSFYNFFKVTLRKLQVNIFIILETGSGIFQSLGRCLKILLPKITHLMIMILNMNF